MTTVVLTLRFDETATKQVIGLRGLLRQEVPIPPELEIHRPHVTLAGFPLTDVVDVKAVLKAVASGIAAFSVRLDSIGIFPEGGTVFLAPRITAALLQLHSHSLRIGTSFMGDPLHHEHALPDRWMPHCTLATQLPPANVSRAVHVCLQHWQPISGVVEAVGALVLPSTVDLCEALLEPSDRDVRSTAKLTSGQSEA
jgi:2'-5' RNA ligase